MAGKTKADAFGAGAGSAAMVLLVAASILHAAGFTILRKGDEFTHAREIVTEAGYIVIAAEVPVLNADGWTCDPPGSGSASVRNIVQVQFEMPGDVWGWQVAVADYPYRTRLIAVDAQRRVGTFSSPGHSDSLETWSARGETLEFPTEPYLAPFIIRPCGDP